MTPSLLLLRHARLFTPAPAGVQDLLLAGGRVLAIAPELPALPAAYGGETVDLDGRPVIPGLIDCHVHLTGGGGEAGPHTRVPPRSLSEFTSVGVTGVIGVLGTDDIVRTTAELVNVTRGFRVQGLNAWCMTGGYHLPPTTLTGTVRGDLALIAEIIAMGEVAISDHRGSQPTLDEFLRLAGEVHVGGLMSGKAGVLHLHMGDGARGLDLVRRALATAELPARVYHPTHVNRRKALFEEALALAAAGPAIDISAFPIEEREDAWSAADALERYLAAGLPPHRVTVSSDGGGCLPRFDAEGAVSGFGVGSSAGLLQAVRELVARGHALETVLPAFTRNVAGLFRLHGHGELAVGHVADLVVLDERMAPHHVLCRGAWHVRDGAVVRRGPFE